MSGFLSCVSSSVGKLSFKYSFTLLQYILYVNVTKTTENQNQVIDLYFFIGITLPRFSKPLFCEIIPLKTKGAVSQDF